MSDQTGEEKTVTKKYKPREITLPKPVVNNQAKKAQTDWDNTTQFEILEDVPLPWTRITSKDIAYPFQGMKVGTSFQFMREKGKSQNVYSASISYCRQPEHFHKRFVIRKVSAQMIDGIEMVTWGCWREDDLSPEEIAKKQEAINAKQKETTKKRHARLQG